MPGWFESSQVFIRIEINKRHTNKLEYRHCISWTHSNLTHSGTWFQFRLYKIDHLQGLQYSHCWNSRVHGVRPQKFISYIPMYLSISPPEFLVSTPVICPRWPKTLSRLYLLFFWFILSAPHESSSLIHDPHQVTRSGWLFTITQS